MALLGCSRDGCIARMWNYICCPFCDCLFNEAGKSAAVPVGAQEPKSTLPDPPNLDSVIAEIDKYCAHILSIPGLAPNPDLKIQMPVLQAHKDKLKAAQAEEDSRRQRLKPIVWAPLTNSRDKKPKSTARVETAQYACAPLSRRQRPWPDPPQKPRL
jgi:hypothetical protein